MLAYIPAPWILWVRQFFPISQPMLLAFHAPLPSAPRPRREHLAAPRPPRAARAPRAPRAPRWKRFGLTALCGMAGTAVGQRHAMRGIKRVALVGGTHGNELSGVHLVRSLLRQPSFQDFKSLEIVARPHFNFLVVGNSFFFRRPIQWVNNTWPIIAYCQPRINKPWFIN